MPKDHYITPETLSEKTKEWMSAISKRNKHKWPFNIGHAALLVIDMQRYFLEERANGFCCGGVAAIPNVQKLIAHFREKNRPIIFTRHAHKSDGSDLGILEKWWDEMPVDGTPEADIDPRLNPPLPPFSKGGNSSPFPPFVKGGEGGFEFILTKTRYSAFYNTELDAILKKLGIKELVITGVMTNICCESTARDAFFRDYMVRFVADATGSVKEEMHLGTLLNLAYAFADVCTTEEVFKCLSV